MIVLPSGVQCAGNAGLIFQYHESHRPSPLVFANQGWVVNGHSATSFHVKTPQVSRSYADKVEVRMRNALTVHEGSLPFSSDG